MNDCILILDQRSKIIPAGLSSHTIYSTSSESAVVDSEATQREVNNISPLQPARDDYY
jgi:hypothetical protein